MAEENKSKNLFEWCDEHPKVVFTVRAVLWALFSAILPFIFIVWRYGIFTEGKSKISGVGLLAIIIAAVFIFNLAHYIYKTLKPGLAKQCISGLVKIILPLLVLYVIVSSVLDSVALFKEALGCVILCEAVGIPLNPFPTWLEKKRIEEGKEKAEGLTEMLWNKFFSKKKEEDKK